MKGLAEAPVKRVVSTGVSTSMKSLVDRNVLIAFKICGLIKATRLESSFIIRSRYLLLYLSSISVKPWNFSGNGLNDFDR